MKIMVSGGAGFIGSNVVDAYIQAGHQVVVVDDLSSGKRENVHPGAIFYETDIRSEEMEEIFALERPDVLNHHAAQVSVPASVSDPLLDADINVKGFLNLLEKAVMYEVKKCIFISSGGAIYGEVEEYPTSEAFPSKPLSPYAVAKLASEYYLACYRHQYGLSYTTLRYANVYGPRQTPHGEAGVVAIFMGNLLNGKTSTLNHFPEDPEGMIRDYCYVGDVAEASLLALNKGDGDFFNIGTGIGTKTLELYRVIYKAVRVIHPDLSEELAIPATAPARPGDVTRSCLRVEKAKKVLGWSPKSDLKEGIQQTLEWWVHALT